MVTSSSRGASTIEYALMVAAIAGGTALAAMTGLGPVISGVFASLSSEFGNSVSSGPGGGGGQNGTGGTNAPGTGSSSPAGTPSPTDTPTPTDTPSPSDTPSPTDSPSPTP